MLCLVNINYDGNNFLFEIREERKNVKICSGTVLGKIVRFSEILLASRFHREESKN